MIVKGFVIVPHKHKKDMFKLTLTAEVEGLGMTGIEVFCTYATVRFIRTMCNNALGENELTQSERGVKSVLDGRLKFFGVDEE